MTWWQKDYKKSNGKRRNTSNRCTSNNNSWKKYSKQHRNQSKHSTQTIPSVITLPLLPCALISCKSCLLWHNNPVNLIQDRCFSQWNLQIIPDCRLSLSNLHHIILFGLSCIDGILISISGWTILSIVLMLMLPKSSLRKVSGPLFLLTDTLRIRRWTRLWLLEKKLELKWKNSNLIFHWWLHLGNKVWRIVTGQKFKNWQEFKSNLKNKTLLSEKYST